MKKNLKSILALVLALVMAFAMVGCGGDKSTDAPKEDTKTEDTKTENKTEDKTEEKKDSFKVGWSIDNTSSPYNSALDQFMKEAWAEYPEVELFSTEAGGDALKQVSDIEDLVAKGVDCIIIKAKDEGTVTEALRAAREEGVMVFLFDRNVITEHYDHFIGVDSVQIGEVLATELLKAFPEKAGETVNYVYLEGAPGASTNLDNIEGFNSVIAASGRTDLKCVGNQPSAAKRDEGKTLMENWIQATDGDIDAVISVTDELTIGAIQALDEAGIEGYKCFSTNAIMELVEYIYSGKVHTTCAVAAGVHPCVEMVWEILSTGEDKFAQRYNTIPIPVNAENVDKYFDKDRYIVAMCGPYAENELITKLVEAYPELDLPIRE